MRELTADQQTTVLYALRVMAKDTRATGKDRREARDVYQHIVDRVMSDDDFRPYDCTGGQWCRCPVSAPCAQRGTSHITGRKMTRETPEEMFNRINASTASDITPGSRVAWAPRPKGWKP